MDQAILREYLIALGFKIDQSGEKKVVNLLTTMDKKALGVGKSLVGLAATVVTTTTIWARQMEKMYYASRYADSTVSRMQELEYGARNIGLESGKAAGALKNMTASIRANPGLIGLLNSLGVEVKGRDKADVLIDLVEALKKMPPYIAMRYANLFGIDQETLFMLTQGIDKLKEAQEQRKKMAAEMGVDADAVAETAKTYMNMWREVTERASLFGMVLGDAVLPYVQELVKETNTLMIKWASIVKDMKEQGSDQFWDRIKEGLGFKEAGEGRVKLSAESRARLGLPAEDLPGGDLTGRKGVGIPRLMQKWEMWRDRGGKRYGRRAATDQDAVDTMADNSDFQGKGARFLGGDVAALDGEEGTNPGRDGTSRQEYLASLERKYNLPMGLLDRVWNRESGRGRFMLSKAGAKGHFGFMDPTAKEYGLKDPNNFEESADASARKWRDLLARYKGDTRMAAAAYNWGDGNLAKYGLGSAPKETRGYMDAVAGPGSVSVQANPEIHVHGVTDPRQAAESVVRLQKGVNADIVRNFSPKVR